jgi:KDO2-lipid IV(A) lauroyltransferase
MAKPPLSQRIAWRLETAGYDALTGLFRLLPLDWASASGGWLLRRLGPLNGAHRTARINLKLAFPDLADAEIERLLGDQWEEFGRTSAEFASGIDRIVAQGRVEIVNIERLHAIRDSGKPVVFISGHFSDWEVMPAAIFMAGVDSVVTYRPANNPHVDKRWRVNRARYGVKLFGPKGEEGARESLLALKRGVSVALMNDQKFAGGVRGPFFGVDVDTAPGPTKLAIKFGTVLQPMTVERIQGARFRVFVHDPIVPDATGKRTADINSTVAQINRFLEDRIRQRPHDWFWTHKRWPNEIYRKDSQA